MVEIFCDIYERKGKDDVVILDNAHSHLSHLVVKEAYEGLENIEVILNKVGIHCDRTAGCDVSGGSLGHGLGIAIGMAKAGRTVHVVVSDGSIMEGSNWEALRLIHDLKLDQIHIYCNFNGYTATSNYITEDLLKRLHSFDVPLYVYRTSNGEGFDGVQGHYKVQ